MEPLTTEEYPPLKEYIFYVIPAGVKGDRVSVYGRSLDKAYKRVEEAFPKAQVITWGGKEE